MPLQRGFKAKANRMSLHLRQQMGLRPFDPINPCDICSHFDIRLLKLTELDLDGANAAGRHFLGAGSPKFSALTMPVGGQRAIIHNDRHGDARQRSNIAHELAHCFLGHGTTPPLLANGDRDRHSGIEEEAAFFGGAILIPNEAAVHITRNAMDLGTATAVYGVSLSMLTYRLRVSGATTMAARTAARGTNQRAFGGRA